VKSDLIKLRSQNMKNTNFVDELLCPACHCHLVNNISNLTCPSCSRDYFIVDDIPDFRGKDAYWCNVSREKMKMLNQLARQCGDWLEAAKKIVPQYAAHFVPFDRADCQFLWPCKKDSRILDAGSMWGGIAIPAAQFHAEVYAVDKTIETIEFLNIRAEQMGFDNIYAVASELQNLPFPDNFFDLVVLNGVLEWVAFEQEVILERHWMKFGLGLRPEKRAVYTENPRATQLRVLREMQRVLKPGGCLYLAIENRIGYIYLVGWPDHMNIPFICFVPRFIANAVTKLFLKCPYRTYVYTIPGYKSLLRQSGFGHTEFYGVFTHYIRPSEVVPLGLIKRLKPKILSTKRGLNRVLLGLVPKSLLRWLPPSVIAIAAKGSSQPNNKPRLVQLLEEAGLLSSNSSGVKIVKCDSRPGNDLTVNYWVYDGDKNVPEYFCKVCRSKKSTDVLDAESENLQEINRLLKDTQLSRNIPKLLYYGAINGITFAVTEFIEARNSEFSSNRRLRTKSKCLDKEIKMAIEFLAAFQKCTVTKQIEAMPYLMSFLESKEKELENRSLLTKDIEISIGELRGEIRQLKSLTVPLCAQHGDYNLSNNILFNKDGVRVVDFEHFQREALPFLDLAALLFNLVLLSYEYQKKGLPLSTLLDKYNLKDYLCDWFKLYAELSKVPRELLRIVPPLAALDQRTIEYPHYRDPETFPINMAFEEFLTLRIEFD